MNEKIKQLVKQAEQYALDRANEGSDEDYDYAFDDDFRQKFAELIVAECINMIEAEATKANEDDVHGMRNAAGLLGRAFITLRGVEE